jgi:hypothetical protein
LLVISTDKNKLCTKLALFTRMDNHFLTDVATEYTGKNIGSAVENRKHDRRCTYNVTLQRVSAITVVVENQCVTYSKGLFVAL